MDWHDEGYRVWMQMFRRVGWDAKAEVGGFLLCDSNKRPDIVIFQSLAGSDVVIDYVTCVVGKPGVVELAATTPLHAADCGATMKCNNWEHLVRLQGDTFVPIAVEDTGTLHDEAVDLLASAASAVGGSMGERQAFLTYWRQTMAITTARGVAKVIRRRVPACTGAHWPVQPHHFQHIHDVVVPPQPRQHLPMRRSRACVPCGPGGLGAGTADCGCDHPLGQGGGLGAPGAQRPPDPPPGGGHVYTTVGGVLVGGRVSG